MAGRRTAMKQRAMRLLPQGQAGRAVAALVAVLLVAMLAEVLLRGREALLLRLVTLGIPSALALSAFLLAAARALPRRRQALAVGVLAYVAVGVALALAPVGYMEAVRRGGASLLLLLVWPTVMTIYWGHEAGWLPES